MPNRSQVDNLAFVNMIDPVLQIINNTTVAGAAIDTQGYDSVTVVAQIGAWGDTVAGGLVEFGLQHSDDTVAGNFTDVGAVNLTDTIAGASTVSGAVSSGSTFANVSSTSTDQKTVKTGYRGNKRYIRLKVNGEKNLAIGTPVAVAAVLGNPSYAPV
jgi:hypothetical protein